MRLLPADSIQEATGFLHAITIAARNYLAMARTLALSFKATNPASEFTILVVDAERGEIPDAPQYHIATPHDLPIADAEFGRMAHLYDVTELSTALKPWALEMLLDRGAEVAMYLDPDIFVYSSLDEIETTAQQGGIVLTPHTTTPMRRDGLRPSEADIMGAGVFNLGFIAIRKSDRDMLSWWQQRLRRDSISAPEQMLFTDQRWIDLVPGYFEHVVLRDPGYNVAYWNLDSRELSWDDGQCLVNGDPLRFFHFSGYRPETPWVLSKYVADRPRVVLSEHTVVRRLCDAYADELRAQGLDRSSGTPYRFSRFRDGTPITASLRRMYRTAVIEAEELQAEYPPAPSDEDDDAGILGWFQEPVRAGTWVNRMVYAVWQGRHDLQIAFPDPLNRDQQALLDWCLTSGVQESGLSASLLPTGELVRDDHEPVTRSDIPGVNLAGYFQTETGVGQIGRLLVAAVKATGLPYSTLRVTRTTSRQQADFDDSSSPVRYPINIATVNADQFVLWADEVGRDLLSGRYTIGVWAWEVEDFPDCYRESFDLVDEIWAISSFGKAAIECKTVKPVHVIPYQVPEIRVANDLDRQALGLPEQPYFLFMFDYLSVFERKNPLGVIEAFCRAFTEGSGPILVIKSVNGARFRTQREQLRRACDSRCDIYLIEDYLPPQDVESLVAQSAAYVSLHRAEGLGLTMSEAMSAGRPVIATGYSGNLDFMDESNSLLVPYEPVEIPVSAAPYGPPTQWADPDLDVAARFMRWVVENELEAAALGLRAQESVHSTCDLDRTADFVTGRIRAISELQSAGRDGPTPAIGQRAGEPDEPVAAPDVLDLGRRLLYSRPDFDSPSRYPRLARFVRRMVHRALAHHDEQLSHRLSALLSAATARHEQGERRAQAMAEATTARIAELRQTTAGVERTLSQQRAQLAEHGAATTSLTERDAGHQTRLDVLSNLLDATSAEVTAQQARVDVLSAASAEDRAVVQAHTRQLADVVARLNANDARIATLDSESIARPFQVSPDDLRITDERGQLVLGYHGGPDQSGEYSGFEDVFRGTEEFVSQRLESYLDLVRDAGPVLDLGCGRGEFLALLGSAGIAVTGIDSDESMVRRARSRGLDVELGDALDLMRRSEPEQFGAVTSFQVVEHLDPAMVRELFEQSFRILRPGGLLIAETVNPHSAAALKTFWLDLTHVRPLFPESLLFLARECRFASARIYFPQGGADLQDNLRRCGEYAILARKV